MFSTTYENYRILYRGTKSTGTTLNLRYRVAGADNTTSNYEKQNIRANSTTLNANRVLGSSAHLITDENEGKDSLTFDFFQPFLTEQTSVLIQQTSGSSLGISSGYFVAATSFTGLTFFPTTGNITGTIRVYGYKN